MALEPGLAGFDRREEVVAQRHQQVDVVEVAAAAEAVSQIRPWIHGGSQLAAARAEEAEVAAVLLRGRP